MSDEHDKEPEGCTGCCSGCHLHEEDDFDAEPEEDEPEKPEEEKK